MRILLSNDDGFRAPGICALYEALSDLGEVEVVAGRTFTEEDALNALRMSVGEIEEDPELDVDGDGRVTAADARLILDEVVADE